MAAYSRYCLPICTGGGTDCCLWEYNKKRYTKRVNVLCAAAFAILLVLHLQTEVIYGKEMLDWLNTSAN